MKETAGCQILWLEQPWLTTRRTLRVRKDLQNYPELGQDGQVFILPH